MAKKSPSPSSAAKKAAPPAGTGREIVIRPTHVLLTAALALLVVVGLLLLTVYFNNQAEVAQAPASNAAPASGAQLPPGAVPIQVQPGGAPIQVQPGGAPIQVGGAGQPQPGQVVYPSGANRPDSTPEGFPSEGPANAPVTILEFSDFQCPYCRIFAQDVLPKLREKYISTGKLRIIWRDMAIRGAESEAAGAAALCAHEQGRFWPYHDLLFARQQGQNEGAFSAAKLKAMAAEVGRIQPELYNQCIDSGRYLPAVKASTQDAQNTLKLTGTPTFFVNGQKIEGNLEWAKWDDLMMTATGGK